MFVALVPISLLVGSIPFAVLGYRLDGDRLLVVRPFWVTEISLYGLRSAEYIPGAMKGSLRTFGNGGMFSITGWYYSKALGKYRTWVTDMNLTVVLRYDDRTLMVSPEDPTRFAAEVAKLKY